jgi:pyruvate-formate lyase
MESLNEISVEAAYSKARRQTGNPLALEFEFTRTYKENREADPATRELKCLEVLFPAILQPMQTGDLLAGRIAYPLVGFSAEAMGLGYYCLEAEVREAARLTAFSPEQEREVEEMLAFWRSENTQARTRAAYPLAVAKALPSDNWTEESGIAFPLYRMAGTVLDYGTLLQAGIPGQRRKLEQRRAESAVSKAQSVFLGGMLAAIGLVEKACLHYGAQAELEAARTVDAMRKEQLRGLARALTGLAHHPPASFREAMQLFWIYALLSGTWNYGRMDVYLGPFLARDLDAGVLDEAEALALIKSLWQLMHAYSNQFNNRVFIGGMGRADTAAADRFAMLALEASRSLCLNQPQLSLRFYAGQNPALMAKAITSLGEGSTFPLLYNDDVNVPAVARAFHVSLEEAVDYTPFGCGEYVLEHRGVGSPNGVINLMKCLEVTLHDGVDPVTRQGLGIATGKVESFKSFADLWAAYCRQVEVHVEALAMQEKIEYEVVGRTSPFLLLSLLYDDCIARGLPIFQGGVRYLGGTLETYGNINAADSLVALKKLVYDEGRTTLQQIMAACDANFDGHESLRRDLQRAPKFGNDEDEADSMAQQVHNHICQVTMAQAKKAGLDSYLAVIINNWANALFGKTTAASPDGRLAGETLANAINPSPGMDGNGITAMLNSLVKLDPGIHAGAVQNMKFSRRMFTQNRPKLEALLTGYFRQGGTQAMITVVSRGDLEAAMREPEKWGHLMVRVGGFSARFIDLPREAQLDVLHRTLYE